MNKLKLKALDFQGAEVLTREQLKKILGGGMMGTDPGGTSGTEPGTDPCFNYYCHCNGDAAPPDYVQFCGTNINEQIAAALSACPSGGVCNAA